MLKLLDFYADWCGPCHQMKPIFAEVEQEMAGKLEFEVLDVDDEQNQAKVQQYGVMSIPTYILVQADEAGDEQELSRKIGSMPKEMLVSWVNENLE